MTTTATTYTIRVGGHLDDHWTDWLGALDMTCGDDGNTTITVEVADQAQLHGVLAGLRDIGAVISELRTGHAPVRSFRPAIEGPLHTERLTLRAATADDAAATWKYRRLDSVNEWLTGGPTDLAAYRELFSDPDRLAATVIVALRDDPTGPLIGDFMLRRGDAWAQHEVAGQARGTRAELGWVLDPAFTGHGYATEAVRELIRHCFADLGVRRVIANCFLENDTSWRLMERVGMRRELHAVGESLHRSGRWLDTVGYAMLDQEWRADGVDQPGHRGALRGRQPRKGVGMYTDQKAARVFGGLFLLHVRHVDRQRAPLRTGARPVRGILAHD